ncbi:unnamed protein product [Eruca vesicaria subsp. sativa]|uniref:Uncharacterized protein n=1 Tax=Eruca vesicaria subsp. sativa TaxID=29727 RepID=A0ABC8LQ73_ERUVS|nr:unnamed protein product [Eruca vesicaria subsp. sativa]
MASKNWKAKASLSPNVFFDDVVPQIYVDTLCPLWCTTTTVLVYFLILRLKPLWVSGISIGANELNERQELNNTTLSTGQRIQLRPYHIQGSVFLYA